MPETNPFQFASVKSTLLTVNCSLLVSMEPPATQLLMPETWASQLTLSQTCPESSMLALPQASPPSTCQSHQSLLISTAKAISISAWTVASLLDSLLSICPCPTSTSFPQGHVWETHSDSLYLSPAWCLSQAFLQSRQSDVGKSEDLWCHWPHSRQPWLLGKRTACLQSQKAGVSSHVC